MGVNKVQLANGETIVDMTGANITPDTVMAGYVGYGADGEPVVGTLAPTMHKTLSVTLMADHWVDNMQSVNVDFATAEAMVIAGGEPESQEYFDCEVWCSGQDDGRLIFSCTYEPMEDVIANIGMLMTGELVISYARGSMIQLTDAADRKLRGLIIYGKTTQNGTPSPDSPVPMVSHGDSGSLIVKIGTSESDTNPQTLTVYTPNGLPGIPVTSGGNYTDENGQRWVCDEVDFAGQKYVQRVGKSVITGDAVASVQTSPSTEKSLLVYLGAPFGGQNGIQNRRCMTDRFVNYPGHNPRDLTGPGDVENIGFNPSSNYSSNLYLRINRSRLVTQNVAGVKAFLNANPINVIYQLITPITTDLSSEELTQYDALRTYSPNTTIYTNTEADMMVRYVKE